MPLQIFLGQLREVEWEKINERLSSAIMETCLALTIFREEFSVFFVAMFTLLTFVKVCVLCLSAELSCRPIGDLLCLAWGSARPDERLAAPCS